MAYADQSLLLAYRDIVLGLIIIFGYILTDTAHYGLFKLPDAQKGHNPKGDFSGIPVFLSTSDS